MADRQDHPIRVRRGGPEWETPIGEEAKEPTEGRPAEVRRMGSSEQGCPEMPCTYEVTVAGAVSPAMAAEFGALREPGRTTTTLVVEIRDQAELQGILRRIEAYGLSLVAAGPRR